MIKKQVDPLAVELTSERMEKDAWAEKMMKEVGETLCKKECNNGLEYVGTLAVHLMIEKKDLLLTNDKKRISTINQIMIDDSLSEQVCVIGLSNLTVATRKYFNPNLKLGQRGDKR
jgi:hypothetical protein